MEGLATLTIWLALLDGTAHLAALTPPPVTLDDARRFAPHAVAHQQTRLAELHRAWLLTLTPADADAALELSAWRREAYHLWYVWDDVRIATNPDYTDEHRLCALARLRRMMGTDWHSGALPPPVPLWRFRRLD